MHFRLERKGRPFAASFLVQMSLSQIDRRNLYCDDRRLKHVLSSEHVGPEAATARIAYGDYSWLDVQHSIKMRNALMDFAAHVDCVSDSAIDLSIGFDEQMELFNMLPNDLDLVWDCRLNRRGAIQHIDNVFLLQAKM